MKAEGKKHAEKAPTRGLMLLADAAADAVRRFPEIIDLITPGAERECPDCGSWPRHLHKRSKDGIVYLHCASCGRYEWGVGSEFQRIKRHRDTPLERRVFRVRTDLLRYAFNALSLGHSHETAARVARVSTTTLTSILRVVVGYYPYFQPEVANIHTVHPWGELHPGDWSPQKVAWQPLPRKRKSGSGKARGSAK